jgi:hypothetical protein
VLPVEVALMVLVEVSLVLAVIDFVVVLVARTVLVTFVVRCFVVTSSSSVTVCVAEEVDMLDSTEVKTVVAVAVTVVGSGVDGSLIVSDEVNSVV